MPLTSKVSRSFREEIHLFASVLAGVCALLHAPAFSQIATSVEQQASISIGFDLIKTKTCLGCHQVDSKRVGPAFVQIAERHGHTNGALDYLAGAIRQGGRGRWGAVPMPAQPQVNDEQAQQIASWILSLKP